MHRLLPAILLTVLFAIPAVAQEERDDETASDETSTEQTVEDSELDEQGYDAENEDDFEASQDVAADQSVAFPTDI